MSHSGPKEELLGLLPLKGQTRGEDIARRRYAVIECIPVKPAIPSDPVSNPGPSPMPDPTVPHSEIALDFLPQPDLFILPYVEVLADPFSLPDFVASDHPALSDLVVYPGLSETLARAAAVPATFFSDLESSTDTPAAAVPALSPVPATFFPDLERSTDTPAAAVPAISPVPATFFPDLERSTDTPAAAVPALSPVPATFFPH
ncbi:hypothetical protein TNCT_601461 [Trichonephila clavata]|uniref:Uncharacterized protein n=1 Tax=Trichonephila clavata TaxID=2740835 RepID=A0A8X6GY62_TRICU|nr:hypothetical protein TNCT_601461 [Trichonephila clavata]